MSETTITTLEQAQDEIMTLNRWIRDLQSKFFVNCVYCGHRYGPAVCERCDGSGIEEYRSDHTTDKVCIKCNGSGAGTPVALADVLREHIMECPKHPVWALKTTLQDIHEMATRITESDKINPFSALEEIAFRSKKALQKTLPPRTSPGICVFEPCGYLEGFGKPGETHDEYHNRITQRH